MGGFISHLIDHLRAWWRAPVDTLDRIGGAVFGIIAFFFMGAIGRALLGSGPVSFDFLALWGFYFSGVGLLIGIRFPKVILSLFAPLLWISGC